eukprot:Gb_10172 [translate_table: standard]
MVKGLPLIQQEEGICEACVAGKQHREKFEDNEWRAEVVLSLIHSDIYGPMKTPSLGGAKYFLTFTDDFSRKVWVYFLKNKSETLEKFKDFKKQVEESNKKIKVLKTDKGGEYRSREFERFCKVNDIKRYLIVAYNLQQNGIEKNLHNSFWVEAGHIAIYVMNRSPRKAIKNIRQEETWLGRKPKSFLKFGSVPYVHIPKEKRHKLEEKSQNDVSKAYKLWDPEAKKVVISRDVIFDAIGTRLDSQVIEFEDLGEKIEDLVITWDCFPSSVANFQMIIISTMALSQPRYFSVRAWCFSSHREEPLYTQCCYPQVEEKISKTPRRRKANNKMDAKQKEKESEVKSEGSQSTMKDAKLTKPPVIEEETSGLRSPRFQTNFALMSMIANSSEPNSYKEAKEEQHWVDAMKVKYNALMKNKTLRLVELPKGKDAIGCKWVFRTKYKVDDTIDKHKARLVVKGYA